MGEGNLFENKSSFAFLVFNKKYCTFWLRMAISQKLYEFSQLAAELSTTNKYQFLKKY